MPPLIIAHRGLPKQCPENTLPSFRAALEHKPDVVECDYRHSADGVPFVIHDEKLDRTTDAVAVFGRREILIGSLKRDELRRLDAGKWFDPKFAGTRLSTLEETIDAVCPSAKLMIERKDGDPATLVELLRKKDVFDRVVVQAFDWPFIAECHRLEPRIMLGALGEHELNAMNLQTIVEMGANLVGWNVKHLTGPAIAAAHDLGLRVWSYTVNDPARARELVAAGLDGVITDRCDVVREWLA
jgi:glycerophosphoryl diester phosphodiesterase